MAARYDQWAKNNRVMTWDYKYLDDQLFGYFDWRKRTPHQILNPGQD